MNEDWSDREVELVVADYFSMLIDELMGIKINKTNHRHALMPLLKNRSDGSVEFKHQNISAVLTEMGYPFIKGYKPRFNFQRSKLIMVVDRYVRTHANIESKFKMFSDAIPEIIKTVEFSSWIVSAPDISDIPNKIKTIRRPIKINYLEREQDNRSLGLKGEELVLNYERHSLIAAGKDKLADKVEWISKELGDGPGFDILSKNINGSDKYVEVKTTKLSKESPFYFSLNEYNFSIENQANYHLYRVFNFNQSPQMFKLTGRYDEFCRVQPTHFRGEF